MMKTLVVRSLEQFVVNPRTAELFQLPFAAKRGLLQPSPLDFGLPDRISS